MIRLRPSGITGMNTMTNQRRVSYDSSAPIRLQEWQGAVRTVRFFFP